MLRIAFVPVLSAFICHADSISNSTHLDIAHSLIDLLSETEICLNSCRDKESVQAALPRFQELARKARDLKAAQAALPDSTIQDDMAAMQLAKDFTTLWSAIRQHIERLENDGLMSPELRATLCITPSPQPKGGGFPH